jgi:TniQ
MDDLQLPIALEPHDSESGMGYCLRCVQANGTNLHWLRRAAGVPEGHVFRSYHAPALATVLQCSESWLETALGSTCRMAHITRWFGFGQEVFFSNHFRGSRPQLCPRCVHLQGYCERAWELSTVTICPTHRCELIDECRFCQARLRWDRPSVDTCQCGRAFQLGEVEVMDGASASEFCYLLNAAADLSLGRGTVSPFTLPAFLRDMSLGGLQSLVDILGTLEHPLQPSRASRMRKALRTCDWAAVVRRALNSLELTRLCGSGWPTGLAIDEAALARLVNRASSPVDLSIALSLLPAIRGSLSPALRRSANQLTLRFEGM